MITVSTMLARMTVDDPEFMTVSQVAELLTVSKMTLYRMIREGDLRATQIGRRSLRIRSADVRAMLERTSLPS
jgi:excisionase family DNA binding protein